MQKLLLYGFLFYLLYKFITELLIPVGKASVQVKAKMKEMKEMQAMQEMQEYQRQQAAQKRSNQPTHAAESAANKDYIDFEEVKLK